MKTGVINLPEQIMWQIWFERSPYMQAMLNLVITCAVCFFQVSVSVIEISRNFVLVVGVICFLPYIMLVSVSGLLLPLNWIKCVLLKYIETKFVLCHLFVCSKIVLISFWKSVRFGLEISNILVSSANRIARNLLFIS